MNQAVVPDDIDGSLRNLLAAIPDQGGALPDIRRFRTNRASTKIVLASWWALCPRSPLTGKPYGGADLSLALFEHGAAKQAVASILNQSDVSRDQHGWAANWVLLPDDSVPVNEIDGIFSERPTDIDAPTWKAVLESLGMSSELAELLSEGRGVDFLVARDRIVEANLRAFVERMCEREFEDTPSLESLILEDLGSDDDV